MVIDVICKMCGAKFGHVVNNRRHSGHPRLYCDDCLKVRNRERVRRYLERLANPCVDVETDNVEITADPIPEDKPYRDRITAVAEDHAEQVRKYVDRLFALHEMRRMDAADRSTRHLVRRVLSDGSVVEWRGSFMIGCMSK